MVPRASATPTGSGDKENTIATAVDDPTVVLSNRKVQNLNRKNGFTIMDSKKLFHVQNLNFFLSGTVIQISDQSKKNETYKRLLQENL